jgi:hypothetical protein
MHMSRPKAEQATSESNILEGSDLVMEMKISGSDVGVIPSAKKIKSLYSILLSMCNW